jgi:hypothetical protein
VIFTFSCYLFLKESIRCKCLVMNLPVRVTIKDNTGKTVKHMSVLGPQNIDRVLLWIWRDLFVSLFSKGSKRDKDKIPEMLEDIETLLGVDGLERLLYGGEAGVFKLKSNLIEFDGIICVGR